MFCYTYLSNVECGLRELIMWSEISSEHPIFLTNVAQCLNITLPPNIVAGLERVRQCFMSINQQARQLLGSSPQYRNNPMHNYTLAQQTANLMQQFLHYDQEFIGILQQLQTLGPNQPVWQTLVHHIEQEQTYMYRLIANLLQQLSQQPTPYSNMYSVSTDPEA
ncbi:hypothetical protein JCM14036_34910 [Desulfotomaculum defluvii]